MKTPKTVLIADDEAHIRRILELKLKLNGYEVITAHNGQEALEQVHAHKPDAVITDINMPVLDGRQLCLQIDGLKELKRFLTIVITARISCDDEDWIRPLQDTDFMEKPFSPSKIVDRLNHYFAGNPQ